MPLNYCTDLERHRQTDIRQPTNRYSRDRTTDWRHSTLTHDKMWERGSLHPPGANQKEMRMNHSTGNESYITQTGRGVGEGKRGGGEPEEKPYLLNSVCRDREGGGLWGIVTPSGGPAGLKERSKQTPPRESTQSLNTGNLSFH